MKASDNLLGRIEFICKETNNLKSFKSYVENSLMAFEEHNENEYTRDDYKILLILNGALENIRRSK